MTSPKVVAMSAMSPFKLASLYGEKIDAPSKEDQWSIIKNMLDFYK